MEITTTPCCRVGSEGQVLRYVVRAQGATELRAAEGCPESLRMRVADTRQVVGGIEADVEVEVLDATPY
jgi:hypothetical protein